jgi:hypothetical protein
MRRLKRMWKTGISATCPAIKTLIPPGIHDILLFHSSSDTCVVLTPSLMLPYVSLCILGDMFFLILVLKMNLCVNF